MKNHFAILYSTAKHLFGKNLVLVLWAKILLANQIAEFFKV